MWISALFLASLWLILEPRLLRLSTSSLQRGIGYLSLSYHARGRFPWLTEPCLPGLSGMLSFHSASAIIENTFSSLLRLSQPRTQLSWAFPGYDGIILKLTGTPYASGSLTTAGVGASPCISLVKSRQQGRDTQLRLLAAFARRTRRQTSSELPFGNHSKQLSKKSPTKASLNQHYRPQNNRFGVPKRGAAIARRPYLLSNANALWLLDRGGLWHRQAQGLR